LKATSIVQSIT